MWLTKGPGVAGHKEGNVENIETNKDRHWCFLPIFNWKRKT